MNSKNEIFLVSDISMTSLQPKPCKYKITGNKSTPAIIYTHSIYLLKVKKRNARKRRDIHSTSTTNVHQSDCSGIFIANSEHIF